MAISSNSSWIHVGGRRNAYEFHHSVHERDLRHARLQFVIHNIKFHNALSPLLIVDREIERPLVTIQYTLQMVN